MTERSYGGSVRGLWTVILRRYSMLLKFSHFLTSTKYQQYCCFFMFLLLLFNYIFFTCCWGLICYCICFCRFRLSERVIRKSWTNWWARFREKPKAEPIRSKSELFWTTWHCDTILRTSQRVSLWCCVLNLHSKDKWNFYRLMVYWNE